MTLSLRCALWVSLLTGSALAQAEVRVPRIFGDHMVLQRQQPIPVWGWAQPGETVKVGLNGQLVQTQGDAQGRWSVTLKPEQAGGPYLLQIHGYNSINLQDVMVGEVWLVSGQSNMEMTVGQSANAAAEIAGSTNPRIRHLKVPRAVALQPTDDIPETVWRAAHPGFTGGFTAVGHFFARRIEQELGVAVGIVNASWGGSVIEAWMSPQAIAARPELRAVPAPKDMAGFRSLYLERMLAAVTRWQPEGLDPMVASSVWMEPLFDDSAWRRLSSTRLWEDQGLSDFDGVLWFRRTIELTAAQAAGAAQLELGTIDDADVTYVNGQRVGSTLAWDAPRRYALPAGVLRAGRNVIAVRVTDSGGGGGFYGAPQGQRLVTAAGAVPLAGEWKARIESVMLRKHPEPNDLPGMTWNAMIAPLQGFAVRGVLWYQGEANVPFAQQYSEHFPHLINDWRARWGQPQMPFYYVQLASFLPLAANDLKGSTWAELREAQRLALKLPATGMAVATDVGDANDIHPRNKQAVGQRLALLALKNNYGQPALVASGPTVHSSRVDGNQIEVTFADVGRGLATAAAGAPLRGFTIADASGRFQSAQARLVGENKVVVERADVARPVAVRYGWVDNPQESNLVNGDGLPASPFRTDGWPWLTQGLSYYPH